MAMNWNYIAGFFDGEGTICTTARGIQWSIAQSRERGRVVLEDIRTFLAEQGIKSSVYQKKDRASMFTLYVTDRERIKKLLLMLYPYLRIKRVEVQDCLRYMRLFPRRKSGAVLGMLISETRQIRHGNAGERHGKAKLTMVQVDEIRRALDDGTPRIELARRYGVHYNTITAIRAGVTWGSNARV